MVETLLTLMEEKILPMMEGLERLLCDNLAGLFLREDPELVHLSRTSARRLRIAVELYGFAADAQLVELTTRSLCEVTRMLGPLRETDVSLLIVEQLHATGSARPAACLCATAYLNALRNHQRNVLLLTLSAQWCEELEALLKRFRLSLEAKRISTKRVRRRMERALTATRRMAVVSDSEHTLHAFRIALKKLRYGLELGAPLLKGKPCQLANRCKQGQELLGQHHDLSRVVQVCKTARSIIGTSVAEQWTGTLRPGTLKSYLHLVEKAAYHLADSRLPGIHAWTTTAWPQLAGGIAARVKSR
jgi:CHAD domain-containing protein